MSIPAPLAAAGACAGSRPALPQRGDALLVVDVQVDFLPGGNLGVPSGDAILAPLNACIERFTALGLPVFASRDWHPADHVSFQSRGGPWPPHCVAGTSGAAFAAAVHLPAAVGVISKGTDRDRDAYSAFERSDLHQRLQAAGVRRLFIAGLATDYCVKASVVDACGLGYAVVVVRDAIAAVEVQPGDGARALEQMRAAGATFCDSAAVRP